MLLLPFQKKRRPDQMILNRRDVVIFVLRLSDLPCAGGVQPLPGYTPLRPQENDTNNCENLLNQ
jgi:hypothetical protein